MSRRSERKTRHHRPYELWKRPSPLDQLVNLVREATGRYPESTYDQTVTLTKPEDVRHFEVGERRSIENMLPEEAIALFGLPVYEDWLKHRNDPRPPQGTATITSIDRDEATIAMSYGPKGGTVTTKATDE